MITKKQRLQIELPVSSCYNLLLQLGNRLPKWVMISSSTNNNVAWKVEDMWNVSISLAVQNDNMTEVGFQVVNPIAIFDAFGNADKTLQQIIEPFRSEAIKLQRTEKQKVIQSVNLCPSCGKQIPEGSKFCPYDGTMISRECPNCKSNNLLEASFCASCGTKL